MLLIINSGSSSIKFSLNQFETNLELILYGELSKINSTEKEFNFKNYKTNESQKTKLVLDDFESCIKYLIKWLEYKIDFTQVKAIGHRIVHGMKHTEPTIITTKLISELKQIIAFAPNHLPNEIGLIEAVQTKYPNICQIACFDTAFHSSMPRVAKLLSIPRKYGSMGIQRYGFHGLSCQYLISELSQIIGNEKANGNILIAHLGNGASITAVKNKKSMDTSMGFTPSSGLMMGTRAGDIDPGLAWYMMHSKNLTLTEFNHLVCNESGLLGVSDSSSHMETLLALQNTDTRASEAIELFCYQAKKYIGSFTAVLNGLETLVFSGGIGENSPEIRWRMCKNLDYLGIELDEEKNKMNDSIISSSKSAVTVRLMNTNEELVIAKLVYNVLIQKK